MKITKSIIRTWVILFLPFFIFKLHKKYEEVENDERAYNKTLGDYIGSKFPAINLMDSVGSNTFIDPGKAELTVVDFWFKECAPCLMDMQRYSKLIRKREKEINVYTVSVNRYDIWKPLLHSTNSSFSMFGEPVPNWTHLVLKSMQDPKLGNSIPGENLILLQKTFQSTKFPMYFVLDKNGIIKATPFSLSKYIELNILKNDPFWYFLTDKATWIADYSFIPAAFVEFSGYFWITAILILSICEFRNKRN